MHGETDGHKPSTVSVKPINCTALRPDVFAFLWHAFGRAWSTVVRTSNIRPMADDCDSCYANVYVPF